MLKMELLFDYIVHTVHVCANIKCVAYMEIQNSLSEEQIQNKFTMKKSQDICLHIYERQLAKTDLKIMSAEQYREKCVNETNWDMVKKFNYIGSIKS